MTAPSLVLLGPGSHDPRTPQISRQIAKGLRELRPALDVHAAYLDVTKPDAREVVARLAADGVEEIVLVPLLLSDAFGAKEEVPVLVSELKAAHPGLRIGASRPIGPEAQLLSVVDRRLRDALRARHVAELDGLVFAAAGSVDVRSNAIIARRARQWAAHHRLPCVTAYATGSGPSTAEAVRTLRTQGRRHVAVGSWYLSPGLLWTAESEAALEAGATAVSAPMGGEPEIIEVALTRYVVAAMELVDVDTPVPYEGGSEFDDDAYEPAGYDDAYEAEELEDLPERHLSIVSA
jgi:sirohydrochlorin ferrochelatase